MKKILSLFIALLTLSTYAQSNYVGFAWNPSPDSTVTGYNLYLNNTNKLNTNTNLTGNFGVTNFIVNSTNSIYATAYDTNSVESEPSNTILIYYPYSPFSLSYTNLTYTNVTIKWAIHTNLNVNAYNIYVGAGTNTNNLIKVGTILGRTNNSYVLGNLVRGMTNYIAVSALNKDISGSNTTYSVLESPLSTNLNIIPIIRPPTNLRINVIIQSTTNLILWNNVTNYEYAVNSTLNHEIFRAKLEIQKNTELVN